ncbi:MAG: hypothetical protein NC191_03485 [Muribaculaceae bacterium]|nr:hypothetical protein [Muribaculaceae bacterium]
MTNNNEYSSNLRKKLSAEKLITEISKTKLMAESKEVQQQFNDDMVRKTWYYQNKFGFETSPRKGHEFWNNEADAFKHAYGSADMALNMGN